MKQLIKTSLLGLSLLSFASFVFADPAAVAELQKRLDLAKQYGADFDQSVRSSKGKEIQKGSGKFYIKHPNFFRMDTQSPQENLIVSDGQTLWFYDPFVSQVTASWVKDSVSDTPFVLLTGKDKADWEQYSVTQNMDSFTLKPKAKKSSIKEFNVRIDSNGLLKGFSTIERDGQSNLYVLKNVSTANVSNDLFKFSLPKGVQLDDQRNDKTQKAKK